MTKINEVENILDSVKLSTLVTNRMKEATDNYKAQHIFNFRHDHMMEVSLSFFKIDESNVYAITQNSLVDYLYKVNLDDNGKLTFEILSNWDPDDMTPIVDDLISGQTGYKMMPFEGPLSDELKFAMGNLNRKAEDIIADYVKYIFTKEEVTTETIRRKLEAKLHDCYNFSDSVTEKKIWEVTTDFLTRCGFEHEEHQLTLTNKYGNGVTKIIVCRKNEERVLFLVSYTVDNSSLLCDFVVNTVSQTLEIAGDDYYFSFINRSEELYNFFHQKSGKSSA